MAPKDDLRINLSTDRLSRLKCMECGHKNPGDVEFCTKCRAKMVLECADCGFKSPQGSEFCGSCGNETEFSIKERQSREREERQSRERKEVEERESRYLKEAEETQSRERKKAKAAFAATPKTIVQKVRHGIATALHLFVGLIWFTVFLWVTGLASSIFSHWGQALSVLVFGTLLLVWLSDWIEPQIYKPADGSYPPIPSPHSPHKVLGVGLSASPDEIRKAYLKLAKAHNPDANQGNPKAAERFNDINSAYSVLKRKK